MPLRSLTLLLFALLLASCQKETQTSRAIDDKILLVGNGGEPKALDPQLVTGVIESRVIDSLMEGLVANDPKSDTAMPPGAAIKWEHNDTFTEWTFHLRRGALWSDGEPVTAHDYVFSYHRMLHPDTAAPYASMLHFLKNAEEFNEKTITDFNEVGVKAIDDYTLHLTMREPVPYLPDITRHYTWFAVPKHVILRYGRMTDRHTAWSEPGNYVGNGGFVLKEWRMNSHIEVVKNPRYHNAANVKLNGVRFFPIDNPYTENRAYLSGQLHISSIVPTDMVSHMKKNHKEELRIEPYVGVRFVRINTTRKGLDDPRVRRAMALAIDRKSLSNSVLTGYPPATSYTPNLGNYKPDPVLTFDPQQAQKLLAEAGYPNGKGFPRYKFLTSGTGSRTAEAIQSMWSNHLNLRFDIQNKDNASSIKSQQALEFDLAFSGWIGDYLDPTTFLLMWKKGDGNNNTGWSDEKFENLLAQAAHRSNEAERFIDFTNAETILMDQMPIIPLVWYSSVYMCDPAVEGMHPLMLNNHPWTDISFNEKKRRGQP